MSLSPRQGHVHKSRDGSHVDAVEYGLFLGFPRAGGARQMGRAKGNNWTRRGNIGEEDRL